MQGDVPRFHAPADARPDDVAWPPMSWPPIAHRELGGGAVVLRPYVDEDAAELFAALDDDRVWAHVAGRPGTPEALAVGMATRTAMDDPVGRFPWVVRLRRPLAGLAAGSVVGTSSYLEVSPRDARLEIGFTMYSPAVWGTVVNPQTKLLLLGHAFDDLGAGRVQLKTDIRNVRSQQAIARLGATYEGVLRRYQRRADGTVRDTVLFSIIAEEWPSVRSRLEARLD
jgi:RimJ/RimL family protein N-acetyltransferase